MSLVFPDTSTHPQSLPLRHKYLLCWLMVSINTQEEGKAEVQTFKSPSAFSSFWIRRITPARQPGNGWQTVKYKGRFLTDYRMDFMKQWVPPGSGAGTWKARTGVPKHVW